MKKGNVREKSFTLIEMIGVMALLAILSTLLVPNIIQKIQEGQRINEDTNLEEIAGALLIGIEREGRFPNPTVAATNSNGWAGIGSKYSVLGTNRFWKVYPGDARNTARRVYLDPDLVTYLNGNYTMPAGGWTNTNPPTSALMYIVSSSKPDLLLSCPTNANLAAADLDWLKNWVKAYTSGGRIAATNTNIIGLIDGTASRWTNQGQYLHVKIVNVRSLLCQVLLEDWHSPITNFVVSGPGVDDPKSTTPSPLSSNNFSFLWTGSQWSLSAQPPRNYASSFDVVSGGSRNAMDITYTSISDKTKTLTVYLPGGPSFSVNGGIPITITDFSPSRIHAFDSTNFYALKGSLLQLMDNTASAEVQAQVKLQKSKHYHVFSYGTWVDKEL